MHTVFALGEQDCALCALVRGCAEGFVEAEGGVGDESEDAWGVGRGLVGLGFLGGGGEEILDVKREGGREGMFRGCVKWNEMIKRTTGGFGEKSYRSFSKTLQESLSAFLHGSLDGLCEDSCEAVCDSVAEILYELYTRLACFPLYELAYSTSRNPF